VLKTQQCNKKKSKEEKNPKTILLLAAINQHGSAGSEIHPMLQ